MKSIVFLFLVVLASCERTIFTSRVQNGASPVAVRRLGTTYISEDPADRDDIHVINDLYIDDDNDLYIGNSNDSILYVQTISSRNPPAALRIEGNAFQEGTIYPGLGGIHFIGAYAPFKKFNRFGFSYTLHTGSETFAVCSAWATVIEYSVTIHLAYCKAPSYAQLPGVFISGWPESLMPALVGSHTSGGVTVPINVIYDTFMAKGMMVFTTASTINIYRITNVPETTDLQTLEDFDSDHELGVYTQTIQYSREPMS